MRLTLALIAIVAAVMFAQPEPAVAQIAETFVSSSGDDGNNCFTPSAACLSFGRANNQTSGGGTIFVLDSGPYEAGNITKALNIVAQGSAAVIQFSGAGGPNFSALAINAGANDVVTVRGVTFGGNFKTNFGILYVTGKSLHVEDCIIRDNTIGINFTPSGVSELHVSNCRIIGNGSTSSGGGIRVRPTGTGSAEIVLDSVNVEGSSVGILIDGAASTGGVTMNVRDSVISGSAGYGLGVFEAVSGGSPSAVLLERTTISGNGGQGIFASRSLASVRVRQSAITGNAFGVQAANGGQIISHGDNVLAGNTTNGAFTATLPAQ